MMAVLAIEQGKLGIGALRGVVRVENLVHALVQIHRLANRPEHYVVRLSLALDVVLVDGEMRRLDRGEGRQLEWQRRMAGPHDVVIGEALVVADMAAHAALSAVPWDIG